MRPRRVALGVARAALATGLAVAVAAGAQRAPHGRAQHGRAAPARGPRTYCNPLDLDYKYNFEQLNEGISYRSGADPAVVVHRGAYYLFETIGDGYWRSTDLLRWRFVRPSRWPFEDVVAPAAWTKGDTVLLMASATAPRPVLYTTRPETGRLEFYNRLLPPLPTAVREGTEPPNALVSPDSVQPGPWDPALFFDEDGRGGGWYLYWGSSNAYPLYGIALDPARRLAYAAGARPARLLRLDPARHGWERFGRDHRDTTTRPFVEGAWMTKHSGRYYLQYAAPGTEYNVYATGTYVGDAPLGPFAYAPNNPVAYKPGGFMTGAGHGSTFRDARGGWWLTGTGWVGANWPFERRIVLFPAAFDADGQYHADTRFGDFPHYVVPNAGGGGFAGWMLLSYRRPALASSALDSFPAARAVDEDPRTFWAARANRAGEWLAVDLGGVRTVRAVQVDYADYRQGLYASDSAVYTRFRLSASADGRRWTRVADLARGPRRDRPNAYVELPRPARARWVRYEHVYTAGAHLALSALRVFGTADGPAPAAPAWARARRGGEGAESGDPRDAVVTWAPVAGAVGYNVRWGLAPDRLYQTYQLWADEGPARAARLEVRALTAGQRYYFAVEAFDERGVSPAAPTTAAE
ncbi:endo-1,4-beta-xylanase [Gemmatimonadetes bacterium T265]|nr:endo-1,4-beta-xylanase [Gemmatimonadetes bacterium T265]